MKKSPIGVLFSLSPSQLFLAVTFLSLAFVTSSAQVPRPPGTFGNYDGKTPSGLNPGAPAGSFALSGFDNINLYNGSINFHLPLIQIGGRGSAGYVSNLSIERHWSIKSRREVQGCFTPYISPLCTYLHTYWPDSAEWDVLKPGYGPGVLQGRQTGKMYYSPNASCPDGWTETLTRLTFTAADGTQYELRDKLTNGEPLNSASYVGNPAGGPSRGKVFATADGSSATFISDNEIKDDWGSCQVNPNSTQNYMIYPTGYLILRDGTRYRVVSGHIEWIRDRNGNVLSFVNNASGRVITDSLNRQIIMSDVTTNPLIPTTQITYIGFGAASRTITIEDDNVSNYLRADYRPGGANYIPGGDLPSGGGHKSLTWLFPGLNGASSSIGGGKTGPTSVILPDGRRYRFYYNPYGELARVELPTGGAMEYDWDGGRGTQVESDGRRPGVAGVIGIYRRVVERRVYSNGTTLTEKTLYTEEVDGSGTSLGIITVDQMPITGTTPLARSKHYYYGSALASLLTSNDPADYEFIKNGREYKTEVYTWDGAAWNLSRKIDYNWQPRVTYAWASADLRLMDTTNTLVDGNLIAKQFFSYSPDEYNNQTDIYEHDLGTGQPGTLIRRTHTEYLTSGYDTIAGGVNSPDPVETIHIRNLPIRQSVYDANGTERARTTYEYDTTPIGGLVDRPDITGLVSRSGQAAGAGYVPTSDLMTRGNVTEVSGWLFPLDGQGSNTKIATYSQYDVAGNVVKARDPKGNDTTLDYSDSFSGGFTPNTFAFLKSVTSPNPGSTYGGNMPLVTTSTYDFSSGKVVSTTDPNSKVTSFEYVDPLDRLTRVARPNGGGETKYMYGDMVGNLFLKTETKQDALTWLEDYVVYDGLGRAKRSAHKEGASGWSVSETQYDALGRVSRVSNPFFAAGYSDGAGSAWITTTYDALSRVTQVTTPDNSNVKTTYLGNQVTVEDQA